MDIRQLKYFCRVAEEKNITTAAKSLFITQPSLSHQLKLLENELGVQLVERGNRQVRLTEAGRLLQQRANKILDLLQTTATEVKDLQEGVQGVLAIGTIASSGVTLLPNLLREFHQAHPQIKFNLYEGDTQTILALLNNGVIEIGIVRSIFDLSSYDCIPLPVEPMVGVMSQSFDDVFSTPEISLQELGKSPLLVLRSNESLLKKCCREVGMEPNILCLGDDVRSLLVLANEGIGIALVPQSALGLVPCHQLGYRKISDNSLAVKKVVIWLKQRYLSTATKLFLEALLASTQV